MAQRQASPCVFSVAKRNRSCVELCGMEFVAEGQQVRQQSSPHKPSGMQQQGQLGAAQQPAAGGSARGAAKPPPGASPTAVADAAPASIASQPSSATSSLAAALADLQVASRQSSGCDLGDRSRLLAGLPPGLAAVHTRCPSPDGLGLEPPSPADSACSPQLVGAIRSFDSVMLRTLTPIKTRSRPGTARGSVDGPPSPPSPHAPAPDRTLTPFTAGGAASAGGLRPKLVAGQPLILHARSSSALALAPNAYNPYDTNAAALAAAFRSPAKLLASAGPSSSRTASSSATPSQWGSASYRASSYRALAAQQALAQREEEPDVYVSVPGVMRRQHSSVAASLAAAQEPGSSAGSSPQPVACESPSTAPALQVQRSLGSGGCLASLQVQRSLGSGSLATLGRGGSGGTGHPFRGLFANLVSTRSGGIASP